MTQDDAAFTGSIPELYERYLGPLFFAPYASDRRVAAGECSRSRPARESPPARSP